MIEKDFIITKNNRVLFADSQEVEEYSPILNNPTAEILVEAGFEDFIVATKGIYVKKQSMLKDCS